MSTKKHCGRCHKCGHKLQSVLDGEEYCPTCEAYRRYRSHGWSLDACCRRDSDWICPSKYGGGIVRTLTEKQIDECFENAENQYVVFSRLYRLIYPMFDDIGKIEGWPICSEKLSDMIFQKCIAFDRQCHPDVIAGGMWMNAGWSFDRWLNPVGLVVVTAPWTPKDKEVTEWQEKTQSRKTCSEQSA